MAKVHLDRMGFKYGYTAGGSLPKLMQQILASNTGNIQRAVGRLGKEHYDKALKRITTKRRRFVLPDVSEALPKRSVFVRKAAADGKRLTDDLRDRLTKNLRKTLNTFTPKTGEQAFTFRRGVREGRVNPKLVASFEKGITNDFAGYTRKDPTYGIPSNIHTIAVTEVRSAADEIKWEYLQRFTQKNKDVIIDKKWIHNKALSEEPRKHHMAIDGQRVPIDEMFTLGNGVQMRYPHDSQAPAEEVYCCHCDFDVILTVLKEI